MDTRRLQSQFFSPQNEQMLVTMVQNDFKKRMSGQLSEKQETRLERTITHYMEEVWEQNGPMPIQNLNREVLSVTINDFNSYLRRGQEAPSMANAVQQVVNMPQRPSYSEMEQPQLMLDTGDRFEQLQKERTRSDKVQPRIPDFRIALEDANAPSPLEQFEYAKRMREDEALRSVPKPPANLVQESLMPITMDPNGNATITLAGTIDNKPNLQQDYIIKQDSVVSYKEVEENLFVWSADRDWLNNPLQTRYNFTVNFDVGNNRQGFGLGTAATKKFKNIVRIELVKVIVPCEGLDVVMQNDAVIASPQTLVPNTSVQVNALSFPYVTLRIPELDGNNYGTDNSLDNAFGVIQYDANWNTDNNLTDGRGFLAMIPKFMKCQKVYQPTPLSTLTKLTFYLQRPTGGYLSDISDSFRVCQVLACTQAGLITSGAALSNQNKYIGAKLNDQYDTTFSNGNALYYIVRTYEAFNRFTITKGDRIQLKGIDLSALPSVNGTAGQDLLSWLQRADGVLVVDIGWYTGLSTSTKTTTGGAFTAGLNAAGYANFIVVQAPLKPPFGFSATSATPYIAPVVPFGGTLAANASLATALSDVTVTTGRLINLSHQTQIVLRVITRELDPTMRVRPDNM